MQKVKKQEEREEEKIEPPICLIVVDPVDIIMDWFYQKSMIQSDVWQW